MSAVAREDPRPGPGSTSHPFQVLSLLPSSHARAWRPQHYPKDPPAAPAPQRERASLSLSTRVFCSKDAPAGFLSSWIWLSTPLSSLAAFSVKSFPVNAALLCCLLFIFFLVLRKDILTIENVKAESEEEPCGAWRPQ